MTEGTPSGEHFGLGDVGAPPDGTPDPFEDEVIAPEASQVDAPPSTEEPPVVEGETEAQRQERLYADRYQSIEQLEDGYKNIQRLQNRTAEQLRSEQLRAQQLEAALQQAAPYLRQLQQQQPQDLDDPQQLQQLIDSRISQGTQQALMQMQAQQLAQQTAEAIDSFRVEHPDAAPGTELDTAMANIILEFQTDAQGRRSNDAFPVTKENLDLAHELAAQPQLLNMMLELDLKPNRENLEVAKEAVAHPPFAEVLMANGHLLDTDEGINYARKQANLPVLVGAAQAAAQPNTQQMRQKAYVETGPSAPVGGGSQKGKDEFDEVLELDKSARGRSVFGI